MTVSIQPSTLSGTIQAPASKSSMQRACAAALLRNGITVIKNPGHSNDDLASLSVIRDLGAEWKMENGDLIVDSKGFQQGAQSATVDCGESGLGIRMFAPIIALSESEITINGQGSLLNRPMDFFDEILPQLGVSVQSNNGKLPLKIKGPLRPGNIEIDGSLSSQFLTGLLMVYSASGATDVSIKVRNLKSKPYIDLTLSVMNDFGMLAPINRNYDEFYFVGQREIVKLAARHIYTVESDWSGGAFLLVAGAIAGDITVNGLEVDSTQADKAILNALKDSGAKIEVKESQIKIGPAELKAFKFDATECPDLFPPLVALAAYCVGNTEIRGVGRLTHKESNRALTLQEEFGKMGINIRLIDDAMIVEGGTGLQGSLVHSHHDHRIAMACAVAALKASGKTTIEEADAIEKSYPDFYKHIESLGASVSLAASAVKS